MLGECLQKGTFLVEKSKLEKGPAWKSQPIWKIDVSRLLKKYEPKTVEGRLVHVAQTMVGSPEYHSKKVHFCIPAIKADMEILM